MVKRMTLWQGALACAVLAIVCMCGFAVAKEKLMLKYLPVDHDIEMVSQDHTANPIVVDETKDPAIQAVIAKVNICSACRVLDISNSSQCPDCCLYNNDLSLIHCQDSSDPACPKPGPQPNQRPFDTACIDCTNTFTRDCKPCPAPCAKSPESFVPCQKRGCPDTAAPDDPSCKADPHNPRVWYCKGRLIKPRRACASSLIADCTDYSTTNDAYIVPFHPEDPELCAPSVPAGQCYRYEARSQFLDCITRCVQEANNWENTYYKYNNGTLGSAVCGEYGNCTAGFTRHCNVAKCQQKIALKCASDYTKAKCGGYEKELQEYLLALKPKVFREIDPSFKYSFVARNGERYMAGWQVLCDVELPGKNDPDKDKYNFYTMIKVFEVDNAGIETQRYESIIHQKSLGSTFYINAQTGFSQKDHGLQPGHSYVIRLYYYLPWDGKTRLRVKVSLLQMILYRTKN
ncbi:MAG: hypothetical protein KBC23_02015 [Candidatus Omnitrophica bacterium]|nr:hypothetical protein [Candidatus Omnitrophota bacterium]